MDLLKYGMENRKSSSMVKRRLAEAALGVEKMKADLEESALERSGIELPELDDEEMLRKIRERIADEEKTRAPGEKDVVLEMEGAAISEEKTRAQGEKDRDETHGEKHPG